MCVSLIQIGWRRLENETMAGNLCRHASRWQKLIREEIELGTQQRIDIETVVEIKQFVATPRRDYKIDYFIAHHKRPINASTRDRRSEPLI